MYILGVSNGIAMKMSLLLNPNEVDLLEKTVLGMTTDVAFKPSTISPTPVSDRFVLKNAVSVFEWLRRTVEKTNSTTNGEETRLESCLRSFQAVCRAKFPLAVAFMGEEELLSFRMQRTSITDEDGEES
jgi:hypothetical protein